MERKQSQFMIEVLTPVVDENGQATVSHSWENVPLSEEQQADLNSTEKARREAKKLGIEGRFRIIQVRGEYTQEVENKPVVTQTAL